jgi:hypothetical protein
MTLPLPETMSMPQLVKPLITRPLTVQLLAAIVSPTPPVLSPLIWMSNTALSLALAVFGLARGLVVGCV